MRGSRFGSSGSGLHLTARAGTQGGIPVRYEPGGATKVDYAPIYTRHTCRRRQPAMIDTILTGDCAGEVTLATEERQLPLQGDQPTPADRASTGGGMHAKGGFAGPGPTAMSFDFAFVIKVFAALFAIMNPFANVPVFLSLTEGASREAQRRVAVTAIIGVGTGCVVSAVAGELILGFFGISVDDFRLAGGVIVLLIALSMLQGTASHAHARTPAEKEETSDIDPESVAIYPLTVPLLVGPGTIATLIIFAATARKQGMILELAVGLGGFMVLLAASLLAAPMIGEHLSQNGTAIARRLMGMILAAIAMEMIVASLRVLLPGLAR